MALQESNVTAFRSNGVDRCVVFLHGYSGSRDDTWDRFPGLLGSATPDWDIFTVGYATTLLPDVVGIWSADPDLPILAGLLRTQLGMPPFKRYDAIGYFAPACPAICDPGSPRKPGSLFTYLRRRYPAYRWPRQRHHRKTHQLPGKRFHKVA